MLKKKNFLNRVNILYIINLIFYKPIHSIIQTHNNSQLKFLNLLKSNYSIQLVKIKVSYIKWFIKNLELTTNFNYFFGNSYYIGLSHDINSLKNIYLSSFTISHIYLYNTFLKFYKSFILNLQYWNKIIFFFKKICFSHKNIFPIYIKIGLYYIDYKNKSKKFVWFLIIINKKTPQLRGFYN